MSIYSILTLIGGLAFFLYGISIMSQGLEKIAGGKLEQLLKKMTSNPIKSFALGTFITAIIQSSSAVTVMLIGLVNSGIMSLSQTVSVIIGANVGTTMTAWLLSLTAIQENAGFFLKLLKPDTFAPVLAIIGVTMIIAAKSSKRKSIGSVMIGFAILMSGMELMAGSMAPLADMPEFQHFMVAFKNPILGFLVGLILTVIIQSSSASIGILQAMTLVCSISWGAAIPIILGQNLGTCISAVLASIGVSTNAKRVAGVHVIYNIISVGICLPLFMILSWVFKFAFLNTDISAFGVAIFHTIYNIFTAFMLFPFAKTIERLSIKYVPEKNSGSNEPVLLDERLLITPSVALAEAYRKTIEMARYTESNLVYATKMLKSFHKKKAEQMRELEIKIDTYEDKLSAFLLKLSSKDLSDEDSNKISQILLTMGDFERIGDHAINILKISEQLNQAQDKLSDDAVDEIKTIVNAVLEIFYLSFRAYQNDDVNLAYTVEPLEAVIKKGVRRAKNNHVQRLKSGKCSADISFLYSDLLSDLRRVAAHAGNVATSVIQLHDNSFDKHEYNHRNKEEDELFTSVYKDYKSRYRVKKSDNQVLT